MECDYADQRADHPSDSGVSLIRDDTVESGRDGALVKKRRASSALEDKAPKAIKLDTTGNKNVAKRKRPFNIFNAIMSKPAILETFVTVCPVEELVSLYAISKAFHYLYNSHMTTYVLAATRLQTGQDTEKIFPLKGFFNTCGPDPIRRNIRAENAAFKARHATQSSGSDLATATTALSALSLPEKPRWIPTLRYLRMVSGRHKAALGIIYYLFRGGERLPVIPAVNALKKMWLAMDIASNANRIGLMHNRAYWSNEELRLAMCIIEKIGMSFKCPLQRGPPRDPLVATEDPPITLCELLFGQRSFVSMFKAMDKKDQINERDLTKMWSNYKGTPSATGAPVGWRVMGTPPNIVGYGNRQNWGMSGTVERLLRVDELVAKECFRRKLKWEDVHLDQEMFKYIDPKTGDHFPSANR
ncbi:hypothetical protein NA57DRAFT_59205 [Rhizodiscina lignyota]|uniref:Uncharacterized protein n=1 Tax=Rhizodiscina lignyota TaxID=1504668 RepID=A0A9P4M3W2_9PEZI|nr:hypothetical protein NA57DRAFT_59205 [Rhizodiscina lignyota]